MCGIGTGRIPRELTPVSKHDDGYEAIKLVMADDYELGEDEHYLDDMQDSVGKKMTQNTE